MESLKWVIFVCFFSYSDREYVLTTLRGVLLVLYREFYAVGSRVSVLVTHPSQPDFIFMAPELDD